VRDALIDRPVVDLDLAVPDDERGAARAIGHAAGGPAFELSAEFATWRALAADGSWHVDVTRLRDGAIEADLHQRDFTANAMAVPLDDLSAAPVDPTGGAEDIAGATLRAASPTALHDDPLRILRAARLGAELGFAIDPETVRLARSDSARAGDPAGERQLAELRQLVGGSDPLRGLELLDELEATAEVLPEVEALKGVAQNPNHHLDAHGHTLEVVRHWLEIEGDLDTYAGESAAGVAALLAEPLADEMTRRTALRFGALLHDIGKPATRAEHEGGFVSFVGHDTEGAEMVRGLCARLKASRTLSRHLAALTQHHLHLGFMTHEMPLSRRRLYEYLHLCAPVAADVTLLTVADRLSARGGGPTASEEIIEAHLELARQVLPEALAWHSQGPPKVPIRGDELADAIGIEPGPELGRLLAELEAAVFAGDVTDGDQAVAYARELRTE
jgi:putative nucleotidyltransferase with HDIG domain